MFMILFLLVPVAEIAVFVQVGSRIGAGMTVLLVVASAVVGVWLVRRQGLATATRVQAMVARGVNRRRSGCWRAWPCWPPACCWSSPVF